MSFSETVLGKGQSILTQGGASKPRVSGAAIAGSTIVTHSEISITAPADAQDPESGNSLALLKEVAKLHVPDFRESSADPDAAPVDDSFSS